MQVQGAHVRVQYVKTGAIRNEKVMSPVAVVGHVRRLVCDDFLVGRLRRRLKGFDMTQPIHPLPNADHMTESFRIWYLFSLGHNGRVRR
jgi:hypothetical protein